MGLFDLFKKGKKEDDVKQEFDGKVKAPIYYEIGRASCRERV